MTILITGGAGYIGSHVVWALHDQSKPVVVVDNLSTGSRSNLPVDVPLIVEDIANRQALSAVFEQYAPSAVMHFAGSIIVPESIEQPLAYYHNNVANSIALIEQAVAYGIEVFIFSSTAAVYGDSKDLPVTTDSPCQPLSPYGHSKLMVEQVLKDTAAVTPLQYGILRYFNVAGIDPRMRCGQVGPQAEHLMRMVARVMTGQLERLCIFGDDYDTMDGTCVRDFIHVSDLADLHVMLLNHCLNQQTSVLCNAGYGTGYTIKQVAEAASNVWGKPFPYDIVARRPGDIPAMYADASYVINELGWQPRYDDLETIILTARKWEQHLLQHV